MGRATGCNRIHRFKNIKNGKKKYYLFLDFDGVINIWCREEKDPLFKVRSIKEDDCQFADIPSIKRLSDLCLKYDINIVISSSWRFAGVGYCQRYLKKCGLKKGSQGCWGNRTGL